MTLYSIRENSLKWFDAYIKGRKQVCSVNGKISSAREIEFGVPQGSNLGPILFLLYINDLSNCFESTKANLFADDTNISCEGSTLGSLKPYETHLRPFSEKIHTRLGKNDKVILII